MPELTENAKRNLASGGTSGPGTDTCVRCGNTKEPTRLNSALCRVCSEEGRPEKPPVLADLLARLDSQANAIRDLRKRVQKLEMVSRNTHP